MSPRRPHRIRRLALAVAIGLASLELGARWLAPEELAPPRVEPAGTSPFVRGPDGMSVYRPHARFRFVYDLAGDARGYFAPDGAIEYAINGAGLRGPECSLAKRPATTRILCLGDSFTFGEGVREEHAWPARLADRLRAGGDEVEVLNAGVQAFGTLEAEALFAHHLRRYSPDVVLLGFFLNDASPFEETLRHHQAQARPAPRSALARASVLWRILERVRETARRRESYFDALRASFAAPRWEECRQALGRLRAAASADGFRFVVVVFPVLWGLDGTYPFEDLHDEVARACAELGCERIDLLETLRGRPAASLWAHPTDHHPNELAHDLAAERIARELRVR